MQSWLSVSGFGCVRGRVTMPRVGVWSADLLVEPTTGQGSPPTVNQPATVVLNGALALNGTVRRAQAAYGVVMMRVVGGGGGFPTQLPAAAYQATQLGMILGDLLSAAGEVLSAQSDASALATVLQNWSRPAMPAHAALAAALAEAPGLSWRVQPDGTTWIGSETWPGSGMPFSTLAYEPQELKLVLYSDAPTVLPGQSLRGGNVSSVEHVVEAGRIRTEVLFEDPALARLQGTANAATDRLKDAFLGIIQAMTPPAALQQLHPGTIVAPGALPNTFDFQPDDPTIPGLQDVPIKTGTPGILVVADPTQSPRCRLGWDGGDPSKPYLALCDGPGGLLGLSVASSAFLAFQSPLVSIGPSWEAFLSALAAAGALPAWAAAGPAIATAASTLLALCQAADAAAQGAAA
jgi:hypothetical protein